MKKNLKDALTKKSKFNQTVLAAFLVVSFNTFGANTTLITGKAAPGTMVPTASRPLNKQAKTVSTPAITGKSSDGVITHSIKPLNTPSENKELNKFLQRRQLARNTQNAFTEYELLLDQTYANNPYSYGGQLSKESIDSFREGILSENSIMPNEKEYVSTAKYLYSNVDNKDVEGNNSYSSSSDVNGLMGTFEYGTRKDESVGLALGGAKQKLSMDKGTELEGSVGYLGVFYKKNADRLSFTTGLGYQLGQYDATRYLKTNSSKFKNEGSFDTDSYNVYGQVKYLLAEAKGWKIEPKLKLSYVFVSQDSMKEDKGMLSVETDKVDYNYFDTEAGVDFTKEIALSNGKLRVVAELGYINTQGSTEEDLDARFSQSSKFEIKGPEMAENTGKIGLGLEYEQNNGMLYSVGSDLKFSSDDRKNTNVRVGLGYKF